MTIVSSSLGVAGNDTSIVLASQVARIGGVHKTLTRTQFDLAVSDERTRITNNGAGIYAQGEHLEILGEAGYRTWSLATGGSDAANAAASHPRTVVLAPGVTATLAGDANTATFGTGVPANGTGAVGDVIFDAAAGLYYAKTGSATWSGPVAVGPGGGGGAGLSSPAFTGVPTAPTASPGTSTTQLATTGFVAALGALKAPLASPTFTGTVAGVTAAMVGLGSVDNTSDTNKAVSTAAATALALKAPLASPAFTATPTAPTAAPGTNNTQISTTAYADAAATVAGAAAAAASTPAGHSGTGGTAHANVVASGAAGFMTGADKAKLDGISAGSGGGLSLAVVSGTKNGVNAAFTIPDGTVAQCFVVFNGQWLSSGNGFTRSAAALTLTTPPGSADDLYAIVNGTVTGLVVAALAGTKDGVNVSFVLPNGAVTTCLLVYNGLWLSVGNGFTRSGATLTLVAPPSATDDIFAMTAA